MHLDTTYTLHTPQSAQRVGTHEVVVANVLVSCHIDDLQDREKGFHTSTCCVVEVNGFKVKFRLWFILPFGR